MLKPGDVVITDDLSVSFSRISVVLSVGSHTAQLFSFHQSKT